MFLHTSSSLDSLPRLVPSAVGFQRGQVMACERERERTRYALKQVLDMKGGQ